MALAWRSTWRARACFASCARRLRRLGPPTSRLGLKSFALSYWSRYDHVFQECDEHTAHQRVVCLDISLLFSLSHAQAYNQVKKANAPLKDVLRVTGCVLVMDGWADTANRPLINVLAITPAGAEFLYCIDTTGDTKDTEYMTKLMLDAIKSVGADNVVCIVTDSAAVNAAAGAQVR
jgi:hypothetical protein